ncbi:MAG: hypothetical protein IPN42_04835 [Methylococcaceae bacterium]|nr:hypothetical protein [Methylococcaceae bacterium]
MNKISRNEYEQAGINISKIKAVMPNLGNITDEMIGSESGAVASFCDLLQVALDKNQKIIINGQRQYDNRNDAFIVKLLNHSMAIPAQIQLQDKTLKFKIDSRSAKVDELTKQGFSLDEIDKICPVIRDEEIALVEQKKEELKSDISAIEAFCSDAPEFRISLLPEHLAELGKLN